MDKNDKVVLDSLDSDEREEVRRRSAPKAAVVYEAVRGEGEKELERRISALAWSGVAAGLSMGFSFVMEAVLMDYLPDAHWVPLISKLGYSIGFLIVVLGRQQLFTESTLTAILPLLNQWTLNNFLRVLRLWTIVLLSNLIGAFLFALLMLLLVYFGFKPVHQLGILAQAQYENCFGATFINAIFAGWLIALMVWVLPFAETGRVAIIIIITYLIGLGKFSHIIAGSVDAFYALLEGSASVWSYFRIFFFPTLLGNIIGGVAFVAAINHAQVSPERYS